MTAGSSAAGVGGITGGVGTAFGHATTVNSGTGNQVNFTVVDGEEIASYMRQLLPPDRGVLRWGKGVISAQEVRRIARCFVEPEGFPRRCDVRVQYFTGAAGVGKRAAAVTWLSRSGRGMRPVRRLPDGATDANEPLLHGPDIDNGELLLLDAVDLDPVGFRDLLYALPDYQRCVSRVDAWLAVIVSREQERELEHSLRDTMAHLHPPDPVEVLSRQLRYYAMPQPTIDAETRRWVEQLPAENLADLAHLTDRAREADPTAGFDQWFDSAVASMKDLDSDVTALVENHVGSGDRATLLASAVLEGFALEHVHTATVFLLRQTSSPAEETPPLERLGFSTRLAKLGLTVDPDRRVRFNRVNYAAAVRDRFWDDRQLLHSAFESWIQECVEAPGLTSEEQLRLARRLAEQCLRVGRVTALLRIVCSWTRDVPNARPLAASQVLTDALAAPIAALTVRKHLYEWAKRRGELPVRRAQVITRVCATTLRESHPFQGFVRLRHLARNPNPTIHDHARSTIVDVAAGDSRFRSTSLQVLYGRGMDSTDRELLFQLTCPLEPSEGAAFPSDARETQAFGSCLRAAMSAAPEEARRHGRRWLDACVHRDRWTCLFLVVDSALAAGRGHVLYVTARRWAFTDAGAPLDRRRRRNIATAVVDRIDQRALGTEVRV